MNLVSKEIWKIVLCVATSGLIYGCGVTSENGSANNGTNTGIVRNGTQVMSPGDLARMQNRNSANLNQPEVDPNTESQVEDLYKSLSNSNPKIRKNAEQTLRNLVNYDPDYLEELKRVQKENKNPDIWYAVSLLIKEGEKTKADADAEEWKRMNPTDDDAS